MPPHSHAFSQGAAAKYLGRVRGLAGELGEAWLGAAAAAQNSHFLRSFEHAQMDAGLYLDIEGSKPLEESRTEKMLGLF